MNDPFAYPWEGGTYAPTDVRIFGPDEPDEDGNTTGQFIVGAGDYCDEGTPDLIVMFPRGVDRAQVEWVAAAIDDAIRAAEPPVGVAEGEPAAGADAAPPSASRAGDRSPPPGTSPTST